MCLRPVAGCARRAVGGPWLRSPGVDQALVYVRLKPKSERGISQEELGHILRAEVARLAGAKVSVFTSGFGGAFKQIQLELRGTDTRTLNLLAEQVMHERPGVSEQDDLSWPRSEQAGDVIVIVRPRGRREEPHRQQKRADIQRSAGYAMHDRHHHVDQRRIDLEVGRKRPLRSRTTPWDGLHWIPSNLGAAF